MSGNSGEWRRRSDGGGKCAADSDGLLPGVPDGTLRRGYQ